MNTKFEKEGLLSESANTKRIFKEFKEYIEQTNEQAFNELLGYLICIQKTEVFI